MSLQSKLWNNAIGYVIISVEGKCTSMFLNETLNNGIRLEKVKSLSDKKFTASISSHDFFKLRAVARRTYCKVKILQKKGLPFTLGSFFARPILYMGFFAFLAVLYVASKLVLQINIEGCMTIDPENVKKIVSDAGIRQYMPIKQVELKNLQNEIELANPKIAWAGARLNGTVLTVQIKENNVYSPTIEMEPRNIVASKDCIVTSITAINGNAMVKTGDTVKANQVLISGVLEPNQNAAWRQISAKGKVLGTVYYFATATEKRQSQELVATKEYEIVRIINFANQRFELDSNFDKYDIIEEQSYTLDNLFVPLEFTVQKRNLLKMQSVTRSNLALTEKAKEKAKQKARNSVPKDAKIVHENANSAISSQGVTVQYIIQTTENVGISD